MPPTVHVAGSIELVYRQAATSQVRVSVEDASDLERVRTWYSGGVLFVDLKPETSVCRVVRKRRNGIHFEHSVTTSSTSRSRRVIVGITSPAISELIARDAAKVELAEIDTPSLTITVHDSAKVSVAGVCRSLDATVADAGELRARELDCEAVVCLAVHAASIRVNARERIRARASDAGKVTISGKPPHRDVRISGAGHIAFK